MRLIDGFANLVLYYRVPLEEAEHFYGMFFSLLEAMHRSAVEAGARFVLVLHPQRFQVNPADWKAICDRGNLDPDNFDLERPNRRIASFCQEKQIESCDLLPVFREASRGKSLYLPFGDTHYNAAGHGVAATGAARCLAGP